MHYEAAPKAMEMVRILVNGREAVARRSRSVFPVVEAAHDQSTADLLTQRLDIHEKTALMLRSLLEDRDMFLCSVKRQIADTFIVSSWNV